MEKKIKNEKDSVKKTKAENKRGLSKKNKILLLILFVVIVVVGVLVFNVVNKKDESDNLCPYSLDEVYRFIENNKLYDGSVDYFSDEGAQIGYVLTHFYECFDESKKFLVPSVLDSDTWETLAYKYISSEEYQEGIEWYQENMMDAHALDKDGSIVYIRTARQFMRSFAVFPDWVSPEELEELLKNDKKGMER